MYVLCTLVVLTLHSLIKSYYKALEAKAGPDAEPGRRRGGGSDPERADLAPSGGTASGDGSGQRRVLSRGELAHCRLESQPGRAGRLYYVPNRRKLLKGMKAATLESIPLAQKELAFVRVTPLLVKLQTSEGNDMPSDFV
ncbi:unnamed protein product [Boreogadus saida]